MDYTQMRFKDLLVSDLGSLPPDAHINEELYNLLTLPYSLGTDIFHGASPICTRQPTRSPNGNQSGWWAHRDGPV